MHLKGIGTPVPYSFCFLTEKSCAVMLICTPPWCSSSEEPSEQWSQMDWNCENRSLGKPFLFSCWLTRMFCHHGDQIPLSFILPGLLISFIFHLRLATKGEISGQSQTSCPLLLWQLETGKKDCHSESGSTVSLKGSSQLRVETWERLPTQLGWIFW